MVRPQFLGSPSDRLPVKGNLALIYGLSLAVALMMTVASAGGLVYPDRFYPTVELQQSFLPNDVVNLIIGLPALLGSMALSRRGRLLGLLLWPGTLLYVVYNAIAYAFALPLSVGLLLWFMLLTVSAYVTIGLVTIIDGKVVQRRLRGAVPERIAGIVLVSLGTAFFLRVIGVMAQALVGSTTLPDSDLAVLSSDLLTAPAWVAGGALLWRREATGYVTGAGLLFLISTLFVGLIAFMLLQPIVTDASLRLADIAVVFVMGLACFIPTGLFLRGVMSTE